MELMSVQQAPSAVLPTMPWDASSPQLWCRATPPASSASPMLARSAQARIRPRATCFSVH